MDVSHYPDAILVISLLSLWILFPVGLFMSVSHVDKNTDQIIRLEKLRHMPEDIPVKETRIKPHLVWSRDLKHT